MTNFVPIVLILCASFSVPALSLMDPCSSQALTSSLLPSKPFFNPAFHDSAPLPFRPHSAQGKWAHFLTILQNYLQVTLPSPCPGPWGRLFSLSPLVSCYPTCSLPSEWFHCEISAPPGRVLLNGGSRSWALQHQTIVGTAQTGT